MEKHNLAEKSHSIYIYEKATKGMFGLPRPGQISHDVLKKKNLDLYGYHPSRKTPRLWKHNSLTIHFTLVVDDFGVRDLGKEHALHLKAAIKKNTR